MRQIRLYTPQPLSQGEAISLDDVAASHLVRVLRARIGDAVTLFNGNGLDWLGTVTEVSKRAVQVEVVSSYQPDNESSLKTHLGLCLSKGERFDWAIQKATEMGIHQITPLFSTRVDVKLPSDRLAKRVAHWQQVVISACEQCGRAVIPHVASPMTLSAWLAETDAEMKLVLHHHQQGILEGTAPESIALLIGPEGGLTEEEVEMAHEAHFHGLRLGPRVLRTETAPVAALAVIGARWGDIQSSI